MRLRLVREHNERAWMIWQAEHLARMPKNKKLPELKTLLAEAYPKAPPVRGWQGQLAVMEAFTLKA